MKKPPAARSRQTRSRRFAVGLVAALVALGAAGVAPGARAGDRWRLDPSQREQLRQELREARGERFRGRAERFGGDAPGFAPAPAYPPGYGPGYPPGAGPGPGPGPGAWHGAGEGPGRQRMSPQEREQLRMMLRERRHGRD